MSVAIKDTSLTIHDTDSETQPKVNMQLLSQRASASEITFPFSRTLIGWGTMNMVFECCTIDNFHFHKQAKKG